MPRGKSRIPELTIETLTRFMETFKSPAQTTLADMFTVSQETSSSIKWESQRGGRGMTPFVPPGAPAPLTAPFGIAQHFAEAAYWKEKMFFDEEFLNNLRKEGTEAEYLKASARLSRELAGLKNRAVRRKEWMFAKMLFSGAFTYSAKGGVKLGVDYELPSENQVTLAADYKWGTGASKDIVGDIIDGKRVINEANGGKVAMGICNSYVLEYMARDTNIQALLAKSTFGQGDLFSGNVNNTVGANPAVIASLLDIPQIVIYEEMYEVRSWLTAVVTGSSTTVISVDDATDWEVGGIMRFINAETGAWEDETIASIQVEASTVTVSTAPTASFRAGRDYVRMTKRFIPDNQFSMIAPTVDGQSIAEYMEAPFGNQRHWGLKTDSNETWDPEGVYIRVQDKGLPILYQRDAIYNLTVE